MGDEHPRLAMEGEKLAMEGEQDEGNGLLGFGCASEGLCVRVWRVGNGSKGRFVMWLQVTFWLERLEFWSSNALQKGVG